MRLVEAAFADVINQGAYQQRLQIQSQL
jgi:hypothetical protein